MPATGDPRKPPAQDPEEPYSAGRLGARRPRAGRLRALFGVTYEKGCQEGELSRLRSPCPLGFSVDHPSVT